MNYLENLDWNKVKADLEKGLNQGMVAVKKGALVVRKKAGELSEEGKRQYTIISLKAKMHKGMSELGAQVYGLMISKRKNPILDPGVQDILARIRKYEATILALEKSSRKPAKKQGRKAA